MTAMGVFFRRLALAASLAVVGCATTNTGGTGGPTLAPLVDPPRRGGLPLVFVAMPGSAAFQSARLSLVGELQKDFDIVTFVVDRRSTTARDLGRRIDETQPRCVVLMDNPTIELFREYEKGRGPGQPALPVVMMMASFVEELRDTLANATGIAYEVPGVTAFVNLRAILTRPVSRVGVLHRTGFNRFVERQKKLAAREQIDLVAVELGRDPKADDIAAALAALRKQAVDTLWLLNDNLLLGDAKFRQRAWLPELENAKLPVIVGAAPLVSATAPFGTFAVLPDHEALGTQAANLIFDLAENEWQARAHDVELPVSTSTILDARQAAERFGLRPDALNRVDRVLE